MGYTINAHNNQRSIASQYMANTEDREYCIFMSLAAVWLHKSVKAVCTERCARDHLDKYDTQTFCWLLLLLLLCQVPDNPHHIKCKYLHRCRMQLNAREPCVCRSILVILIERVYALYTHMSTKRTFNNNNRVPISVNIISSVRDRLNCYTRSNKSKCGGPIYKINKKGRAFSISNGQFLHTI